MNGKRVLTLMLVEWGDAWTGSVWIDRNEINDTTCTPAVIFSVGWLVHVNKKGVYLASRIDDDNQAIGNRMFIPRGMIRSMKRICAGRLIMGRRK